ncbi:DUF5753 domain-containing protein [Actinoplanes sp. KI2]|uniref:DUF5753 domain-containing protein n=1 Tax=Actinoplanes sp. KI2 TaxID=2983315 RepID=UPI0021D5C4B2|nr:DUF5753 domain-containing protein [Actinoplanes sp. KI2]MCU7727780.1 DUF5753 domain-containing protein [Actinoplanes sp. KI2]
MEICVLQIASRTYISVGPYGGREMTKMFDVRNSVEFRRLRDTERVAHSIFLNQPNFIPGVLQDPAYAQEMISRISGLPAGDAEVAERVQVREERHRAFLERLSGDDAPQVHVVLDESVLRRTHTGSDTMRKQIEHLIEVSRRPTVKLGILALDHGPHQGLAGSFEVHDTADTSLVFFEGAEGDRILEGDDDRIGLYRALVGSLMDIAASGEDARTLMAKLVNH